MSTPDYSQEPKNAYLFKLINLHDKARALIFEYNNDSKAWDVLEGLIRSLNEISQKSLKNEIHQLEQAIYGYTPLTSRLTREIFGQITSYLNKTYFEEFNFATVPTVSLPQTTAPHTRKINEREKAKI